MMESSVLKVLVTNALKQGEKGGGTRVRIFQRRFLSLFPLQIQDSNPLKREGT